MRVVKNALILRVNFLFLFILNSNSLCAQTNYDIMGNWALEEMRDDSGYVIDIASHFELDTPLIYSVLKIGKKTTRLIDYKDKFKVEHKLVNDELTFTYRNGFAVLYKVRENNSKNMILEVPVEMSDDSVFKIIAYYKRL